MTIYRHRISGPGTAGDVWVSTLHTSSGSDLPTMHAAYVDAMTDFWTTTFGPKVSPRTEASQFITDALDPITGKNTAQLSSAVNLVGTGTGSSPSPRACTVFSLLTALPTRAGRGRMYWPSPDSDAYAFSGEFGQFVADAFSAGMKTALLAIKTTGDPVIFHRATNTSTLITGVKVGTIAGTQRRRTNKAVNTYSQNNF